MFSCWISSSDYPHRVWALAGPATIIMLCNCLIIFLAVRAALTAKVKKQTSPSPSSISGGMSSTPSTAMTKISSKFSWLKGYISLMVLLGTTWICYVFYIHEFGSVFSYFFIVLNGLQVNLYQFMKIKLFYTILFYIL